MPSQWYHILWIGAVVGLSSGLFGIGGALLSTPLLRIFLALPPLLALGTPIPVAIPSAVAGAVAYSRKKLVHWHVARMTLLVGIPANVFGAYATEWVSGQLLMILTAVFLFGTGAMFFIRGWILRGRGEQEPNVTTINVLVTGMIAGFLSGFLAIGGGIVMVPAFVRLLRLPLKQALATSLLCVAGFAIPSTITHFLLQHIDPVIAGLLAAIVIPFGYWGARIAIRLRNQVLERIYGTTILLFALYFLYTQW